MAAPLSEFSAPSMDIEDRKDYRIAESRLRDRLPGVPIEEVVAQMDTAVKPQVRIEIIDYIPPRLVNKCWRFIHQYVDGCVKYMHKEYCADDIFDALSRGQWGLSLVFSTSGGHSQCLGFYATCVVEYPQMKALRIMALGGRDLKRWKREAAEALRRMQEVNGCERTESFGRRGWLRMLPGHKWDVGYYYLATDLGAKRR